MHGSKYSMWRVKGNILGSERGLRRKSYARPAYFNLNFLFISVASQRSAFLTALLNNAIISFSIMWYSKPSIHHPIVASYLFSFSCVCSSENKRWNKASNNTTPSSLATADQSLSLLTSQPPRLAPVLNLSRSSLAQPPSSFASKAAAVASPPRYSGPTPASPKTLFPVARSADSTSNQQAHPRNLSPACGERHSRSIPGTCVSSLGSNGVYQWGFVLYISQFKVPRTWSTGSER
jgi:hypothetical protein